MQKEILRSKKNNLTYAQLRDILKTFDVLTIGIYEEEGKTIFYLHPNKILSKEEKLNLLFCCNNYSEEISFTL